MLEWPSRLWRIAATGFCFSVFGLGGLIMRCVVYPLLLLFVQGAQKAGPNLSTDSFIKAMDSLSAPPDLFGGPAVSFSATKRLGNATSRLSQIQDGRWKPVSDYIKP